MKKKNKILWTFIVLFYWFSASGQITIDQSDMPVPGDTLRKSTALNSNQFDFSETGADHTWDFSGLIPLTQAVDTFVKVTETPLVYWVFFLTSANMASPMGSSPIEQIPLTETYNFFNNTTARFTDVGYAATVFGLPLPFKFDEPDVLYDFPVDYGNVDSSESGFQFAIPDLAYLMVDRKRINTVDGWGNLVTPYGTYEVLRIKSEVTEYDSIYIDSLNIGLPINLEYIEYKWMAKGQKIPLLKATENLLGVVAEYRDSIRDLTVDVPDYSLLKNHNLLVYPNPVNNKLKTRFYLESKSNVEITIIGLDGKKYVSKFFKNLQAGQQIIEFSLGQYLSAPGRYLLNIKTANYKISSAFIYLPSLTK